MADASTLREYFHLGEDENVITRGHFIGLAKEIGMSEEELEIIFTALDTDENDIITLEELLEHWNASNATTTDSHSSNVPNGQQVVHITPVITSPIDSDFDSSFTLDDSYNGGSFYSSIQSSCVIDDDDDDDFDDTFYDISLYTPVTVSALHDYNNSTNTGGLIKNGSSDNNNKSGFDYANWVYNGSSNNHLHHNNHNNHHHDNNSDNNNECFIATCHDSHNGSVYSNEDDEDERRIETESASSMQLKKRRQLAPPRHTSTPTVLPTADASSPDISHGASAGNTRSGKHSPVRQSHSDNMDTNSSSTSKRQPQQQHHHRSSSIHDNTDPSATSNTSNTSDQINSHDNESESESSTSSQVRISTQNNSSHPNNDLHQNNNEIHSSHQSDKNVSSHCDQNGTSFQVINDDPPEADTSKPRGSQSASSSHKQNSIRVLKTESDTKAFNLENRIRSPITLELNPRLRRKCDISERSSILNETILEYDSPKLRSRSSNSQHVVKRRSLQPETVYCSSGDFTPHGEDSNFPIDLEPLSKESQEQVCELYQSLHGVSNPDIVAQFENILLNVIKDVRQYKQENERLEKTYRKEKDEHDRHLRHMEDEMEQQVQNIEHRVRKQEKERLECEKVDLRVQLDSEITMLQQNLKKLQQDGMNKMDNEQEEHLLSMKKRLEEIHMQNRLLKSELTDAQTNLALVKTEMTSVKQQLDEKTYELDVENKTVEVYQSEQDSLRRQLQLLHEANKNLLDTNDNLREMLDTTPNGSTVYKRTTSTDSGASARSTSPLPPRKGSVMSDYVDAMSPGNRPLLQPSFQEEVGMLPQFMAMNHRFESCEEDSIAEELDSGHSTLRDVNDLNEDTECDSASIRSDLRRGRKHRRVKANLRVPLEEEDESHDEMEMESDGDEEMLSPDPEIFRKSSPNHYRSPSTGSRGSNRSNRSLTREESFLSSTSRSSRGSSSRRQLPAVPKTLSPMPVKITKEPDRVYKIVLAGDAAVGKSSFIVRLCKGKFVPNLSSTLGVDFQTKMLDVDGNTTALQLWDTAGQERFRSVARTYFRRADGVLLLYDVTYERSFLNIRDWVDAIEENAVKKIPIMLVGNKTDARLELEQQGRKVVKYEDGLRLSKDIDAHFIESSAKDGSNIHEAVIELTRALRTNEDLEVQTVGLTLSHVKDKKSSSCCGKS